MTITLLGHAQISSGSGGGTTGAFDATGGTLLAVSGAHYNPNEATPSDSLGNTYVGRTHKSSSEGCARIWDCVNPTVGSSMTGTYSNAASYPTAGFAAFSGTDASSFDQQSAGATGSGVTTLAAGSLTPSVDNSLVLASLGTYLGVSSTISGFTDIDRANSSGGNHIQGHFAYVVQGSKAAVNPTFSWTTGGNAAAVGASYKPAAGGGDNLWAQSCM